MDDEVIKLLNNLGMGKWVVYIVLGFLVLNGIATSLESLRKIWGFVRPSQRDISDRQLKKRILDVYKDLIDLISERQASKPADDPIVEDDEKPYRRVTRHDLGTQTSTTATTCRKLRN
jgi:hypothetical protein